VVVEPCRSLAEAMKGVRPKSWGHQVRRLSRVREGREPKALGMKRKIETSALTLRKGWRN